MLLLSSCTPKPSCVHVHRNRAECFAVGSVELFPVDHCTHRRRIEQLGQSIRRYHHRRRLQVCQYWAHCGLQNSSALVCCLIFHTDLTQKRVTLVWGYTVAFSVQSPNSFFSLCIHVFPTKCVLGLRIYTCIFRGKKTPRSTDLHLPGWCSRKKRNALKRRYLQFQLSHHHHERCCRLPWQA